MCCHGKEREHPDEKEMIRYQGIHLGEANACDRCVVSQRAMMRDRTLLISVSLTLNTNSLHDLRVAIAVKQLAAYSRALAPYIANNDTCR